jgi:hypothetical protein
MIYINKSKNTYNLVIYDANNRPNHLTLFPYDTLTVPDSYRAAMQNYIDGGLPIEHFLGDDEDACILRVANALGESFEHIKSQWDN